MMCRRQFGCDGDRAMGSPPVGSRSRSTAKRRPGGKIESAGAARNPRLHILRINLGCVGKSLGWEILGRVR